MLAAPNTLNYMVGKGKVYFNRLDADNNPTGELDLGNDPSFANTPTVETLDHYSSMEGIKKKDKSANISTDVAVSFTLDEINPQNLVLALYAGEIAYTVQGDGNAVDEAITAKVGRYIKLAFRKLTSGTVVVTNSGGTVTYTETTDYIIDYTLGRIFTVSGGAIADSQAILVDYTYEAQSLPTVNPATRPDVEGLLRFVGDNTFGPSYEIVYWRVKLKVTGDISMISDDWTQIAFEAEVLDDTANHPDSPYGQWYDIDGDTTPES